MGNDGDSAPKPKTEKRRSKRSSIGRAILCRSGAETPDQPDVQTKVQTATQQKSDDAMKYFESVKKKDEEKHELLTIGTVNHIFLFQLQ